MENKSKFKKTFALFYQQHIICIA